MEKYDDQQPSDTAKKFLKSKKETTSQESYLLNIDARKAASYESKQEKRRHRPTRMRPDELKVGLHKMRKRIRDAFEEDEDEDENDLMFAPIRQQEIPIEEEALTLINALTPDERRQLYAEENQRQVRMQQNAGKMEAMITADKFAREITNHGIDKSAIDREMQEALFLPKVRQDKVIQNDVAQRLGLRGKIEDGKIIQAARGIKKAQQIGGDTALKDLKMSEVVEAGEGKMSDRDLAKLILKKSGQDIDRYEPKKPKKTQSTKLKHLKNEKTNKPIRRSESSRSDI